MKLERVGRSGVLEADRTAGKELLQHVEAFGSPRSQRLIRDQLKRFSAQRIEFPVELPPPCLHRRDNRSIGVGEVGFRLVSIPFSQFSLPEAAARPENLCLPSPTSPVSLRPHKLDLGK